MKPDLLLTCALDIGEQMLISGAEIGRVEDTVRHICRAYGCNSKTGLDFFIHLAFLS